MYKKYLLHVMYAQPNQWSQAPRDSCVTHVYGLLIVYSMSILTASPFSAGDKLSVLPPLGCLIPLTSDCFLISFLADSGPVPLVYPWQTLAA